jgi:sulfur transfer complex TusBCD TusB component (DsrH family)
MAKVDPKVREKIADLESKLLLLKDDKKAREATEKLIQAIKKKHGLKS